VIEQGSRGGGVIFISFLVALILAILPLPDWAAPYRPAWVVLVLIYWCMALPVRVSVGAGWIAGLMLDLLNGALLGQNALAYAVVAYVTVVLHQRLRVFPLWQQALSVLLLVALGQLLVLWVLGIVDAAPNSLQFWLPSVTSMLLWPWLFVILRDARRRFGVK